MNPDTGQIAIFDDLFKDSLTEEAEQKLKEQQDKLERFETEERMRAAGYTVPVPGEQLIELAGKNRKERRAWAAQQRAIEKIAKRSRE